jgi:hypothetical protein
VVSHSLRRVKGKSGLASRVHSLAQVHKWPSVSRTSSSGSVIGVGVCPFGCILGTCTKWCRYPGTCSTLGESCDIRYFRSGRNSLVSRVYSGFSSVLTETGPAHVWRRTSEFCEGRCRRHWLAEWEWNESKNESSPFPGSTAMLVVRCAELPEGDVRSMSSFAATSRRWTEQHCRYCSEFISSL